MKASGNFKDAYAQLLLKFPIPGYLDESFRVQMSNVVQFIGRYIPKFEECRLLDVGSGPMDKTAIFRFMGFDCSAVDDLSDSWHQRDSNTERIKEFGKEVGIKFFHQQSGDFRIPFEQQSFDVVCSLAVIEHLHESPRGILNAMGTFVKEDGLILIGMPNSVNLRKRLYVLVGKSNHVPIDQFFHSSGTWRGHVREYTLAEMKYICREVGFEVIDSMTCEDLAYTKLTPPLRNVYLLAGKLLPTLRSSLFVLCRRPKDWRPREADPDAFRRATSRSVPSGVA